MRIGNQENISDAGIKNPTEGLCEGKEVPNGYALVKAWVWTGDPLSVSTGAIFIKLMHLCHGTGESAFMFSIQRFYQGQEHPPVRSYFMIEDMTEADIEPMLASISKHALVVEGSMRVVESEDAPF